MSKTKRLSYRLREGDAMVVGPAVSFETLAAVCDACSRMTDVYAEDQVEEWTSTALWLRSWVEKTEFVQGDLDDNED